MQKQDQGKKFYPGLFLQYILKSTTAPQIFVVRNTLKIDVII
jgi:hypothetical protein